MPKTEHFGIEGLMAHCGENYEGPIPDQGNVNHPSIGIDPHYPATFCIRCSDFAPGETVSSAGIKLKGFTHTFVGDIRVLITKPDSFLQRTRTALVMWGCFAGRYCDNIELTIQSGSPAAPGNFRSERLITSTFGPGVYGAQSNFPAPNTPKMPYASGFSDMIGAYPFGCWFVYLYDATGFDSGSLAGLSLLLNGREFNRSAEHVVAQ